MSRRGFFAELHHQAVLAARENERAKRAAVREHNEAVRDSDRKRKEAERRLRDAEHDRVRDSRSAEAERKRLEHEASEAHVAAMEAEAEARTFKVAEVYTEIDSLLAAALKVDDYVDLETLRVVVKHPPFNRPELEAPAPAPDSIPDPPKPIFVAPDPPKGFAKLFGKTRHAEALAKAQQAHELALSKWRAHHDQVTACRTAALTTYADAEARRVVVLETERARYAKECTAREAEAAERNSQLDELIANLGYGTVMAVQEYVSIVLSNSVYPEHFAVTHEFEFEASSA
jgi:restriction system protein